MTASLNFEAEPLGGFTGSHSEVSEETQDVRDHRPTISTVAVRRSSHRRQRSSGSRTGLRDPLSRQAFPSSHVGNVHGIFRTTPARVISSRPSFGRGISDPFRRDRGPLGGVLNRSPWNRGWSGGWPGIYGARGAFGPGWLERQGIAFPCGEGFQARLSEKVAMVVTGRV